MSAFYLQDYPGHTIAVLNSVEELAQALKKSPGVVVAHHLRSGRNDFAAWIKHELKNEKLAEKIKGVTLNPDIEKTKEEIIDVLEGREKLRLKKSRLGDNPLRKLGKSRRMKKHPLFRFSGKK